MLSERQIEICESRCNGCEFCVAACTHGVLRMDGGKPVVEDLERCTGCELCVWICPAFAITLREDASYGSSVGET